MRVFAKGAFRYSGIDYPYGWQDLPQSLADTLLALGLVWREDVTDGLPLKKSEPILLPSEFGWSDAPINVKTSSNGKPVTEFSPYRFMDKYGATPKTYYVEPTGLGFTASDGTVVGAGSAGNNGTSISTPMLKVSTVLALSDVDIIYYLLNDDYIGGGSNGLNAISPTNRNVAILPYFNNGKRFISLQSSATPPTWALTAGTNGLVWETAVATGAQSTCRSVIDLNPNLRKYTQTLDDGTVVKTPDAPEYQKMICVGSLSAGQTAANLAAVGALPGSWAWDADTQKLYVHPYDNRVVTNDSQTYIWFLGSSVNLSFRPSSSGIKYFVKSIDCIGGNYPLRLYMDNSQARVQGSSLGSTPLATLTAITAGSLSVTIDGVVKSVSATLDLHSATTFAGVASLIATALGIASTQVVWDTGRSCFIIMSANATAANSTMTQCTGATAALLGLDAGTLYQGYNAPGSIMYDDCAFYHENCTFQGGALATSAISSTGSNGYSVVGKFEHFGKGSWGLNNGGDDINIHDFSSSGIVTTKRLDQPKGIFVNCGAKGGGTTGSTAGSDNNFTGHDSSKTISVGCYWLGSSDKTFAFIGNSQVVSIGDYIGQPITPNASYASVQCADNCRMWLINPYLQTGSDTPFGVTDHAITYVSNANVPLTNIAGGTGQIIQYNA